MNRKSIQTARIMLVTGAIAGFGAGLLMAPRSGKSLRKRLTGAVARLTQSRIEYSRNRLHKAASRFNRNVGHVLANASVTVPALAPRNGAMTVQMASRVLRQLVLAGE
jgi:hypothetical protein